MNTILYVTAKFSVKKEKIPEAIQLMNNLATATHTEQGCKDYYYLQNQENECEFTSFEIWENQDQEALHRTTPHIQAALSQLPDLLDATPDIKKWVKINTL
jgi:quinol monooxygenase YgiN